MNKKEFALFASALRTYYPREKLLPNDQAMDLWFKQLEDIPYNVAEIALNKWVAMNTWSPSIADIRKTANGLTRGEEKTAGEAWADVVASFGPYGRYRITEALESFDEVTRKVVKQIGYVNICDSENPSVIMAQFERMYNAEVERKKQGEQLPPRLQAMLKPLLEGAKI